MFQPLVINTGKNRHVIIGIVSFGIGCGRSLPGVYFKLATKENLTWIKKILRDSKLETENKT